MIKNLLATLSPLNPPGLQKRGYKRVFRSELAVLLFD